MESETRNPREPAGDASFAALDHRGQLIAALTMWLHSESRSWARLGAYPRRGILGQALALGFLVGTLVAIGLGSVGLLISGLCNSNKTSIAASIFLLLILFAPTQLPGDVPQVWFFDVLLRLNPVTSGLGYISAQLVNGHAWTQDLVLLITPLLTAIIAGGALVLAGERLVKLTPQMQDEGADHDRAAGRSAERGGSALADPEC